MFQKLLLTRQGNTKYSIEINSIQKVMIPKHNYRIEIYTISDKNRSKRAQTTHLQVITNQTEKCYKNNKTQKNRIKNNFSYSKVIPNKILHHRGYGQRSLCKNGLNPLRPDTRSRGTILIKLYTVTTQVIYSTLALINTYSPF